MNRVPLKCELCYIDRGMSHRNRSEHDDAPAVAETAVKRWLTYESMSPLGRALMSIANDIEKSGERALDEQAIERELATRRGGYTPDGQ